MSTLPPQVATEGDPDTDSVFQVQSLLPLLSSIESHSTISVSSTVQSVRIVVIGDCHDDWSYKEDSTALQYLQPDLVLFTGDFGNEDVELVKSVADVEYAKAAILGNHDAWKTKKFKKSGDGVQAQMQYLGDSFVGYSRKDFPGINVSVVGGRPFSVGGEVLFREKLLSLRYGVHNMDESAKKIVDAAIGTSLGNTVVFLAHNGPKGLGSNMDDICGKDWGNEVGDHGDPDLEKAISDFKETTQTQYSPPLVVFGHMHKTLADGTQRKMVVVGADKTIYLNGAIVPRVKNLPHLNGSIRAYTLVELRSGNFEKIMEIWISVIGNTAKLEEEQILFVNCSSIPS